MILKDQRALVGLKALMAEKAEVNLMVAMTTGVGSAVVWTVVETRRK